MNTLGDVEAMAVRQSPLSGEYVTTTGAGNEVKV